MSALQDLKILAADCEELAMQSEDDKGLQRALLSVVFRIRRAAKKIEAEALPLPTL